MNSVQVRLHATTVAFGGRGLLIMGPSGVGKSALALDLMAAGARLVADDCTIVSSLGETLIASCPPEIRGLVEARGVGVLRAIPLDDVPLAAAVDLGRVEVLRLPEPRRFALLDRSIPLLFRVDSRHFPSALLQYLRDGPAEV